MDTVYKYCCSRGLDILEKLELKITPPNQFNDPFEFTPRIICSVPIRRSRDILRNKTHLKTLYDGEKGAGLFSGSFREYRKFVRDHRQKIAQGISGILPGAAAEVQQNVLDRASRTYGVLCLSKTRESILMWGHYCDKHRGLLIGFDASHSVFKTEQMLSEVTYVRERIIFDASWIERDPKVQAFGIKMMFSKNEDWSYEQEVRQVFNLSTLRQEALDNGSAGYFLPLPAEAVTGVSLGARCPDPLKMKVLSALKNPKLSHVKLDRAVLQESEFALRFEAVSMNP